MDYGSLCCDQTSQGAWALLMWSRCARTVSLFPLYLFCLSLCLSISDSASLSLSVYVCEDLSFVTLEMGLLSYLRVAPHLLPPLHPKSPGWGDRQECLPCPVLYSNTPVAS